MPTGTFEFETTRWQRLGEVGTHDLIEARLQAHYAAQWLARVAIAALPARADHSHLSLGWNGDIQGLVTHSIMARSKPVQFGLSLTAGRLVILEDGKPDPNTTFALDAVTDGEVSDWMSTKCTRFGVDPGKLKHAVPYNLPYHAIQEGGLYGMFGLERPLTELARWFANAQSILKRISTQHSGRIPGPMPARIWPHHFDLGMLIVLEDKLLESARSVGLGLSPGDDIFPEPYFYAAPYPRAMTAPNYLPPVTPPAGWRQTDTFTGIVLRGSDLLRSGRSEEVENVARTGMETAVAACIASLNAS